jgi:hypothetical protein
MGGVNYSMLLESGFDYEKSIHKSLAWRDFLWVYPIKEMGEEIDDNF